MPLKRWMPKNWFQKIRSSKSSRLFDWLQAQADFNPTKWLLLPIKILLPFKFALVELSEVTLPSTLDISIAWVALLDDCKDIDNITKIEKSFIKNGIDEVLDSKIKTLMDSQDQLEAWINN